jgi:hypothetical protein
MSGLRDLLDQINRQTDEFLGRAHVAAPLAADWTADGRFTLAGLVALLAVGARDVPRRPRIPKALGPVIDEQFVTGLGRLGGVPVGLDEAGEALQLLRTGELVADVVTGLRAALALVPRLPRALARDLLALPRLPGLLVAAVRADFTDDPERPPRDVLLDLSDGRLDTRRRILTNTLRVLLAESTSSVLVETLRDLIGPENRTVRLALIVYARTQGIDLEETDLDALHRALDPARPDLGVLLGGGLEHVLEVHGEAAQAIGVLDRLAARHPRQA